MRLALLVLTGLLLAWPASAQVGFNAYNGRNHPELDWQVATTEHFELVYPARLAGIEAELAPLAEASYRVLSANFGGVTFDRRIRLYVSDEDEIANGTAWPVGPAGFTTIWVHVNDFADTWTGDVKWLRKVVAHELAHLFHYRAVRSNLGLLQNLLAEPFPRDWTEGLAQYQTERWDAQRGDRWLRTAVFEDRLNPDDGAGLYNGRLLYAIGNSQVRVLADRYGDSTLVNILRHRKPVLLGLGRVHDFRSAFEDVTGEAYGDFVTDWRQHVNVYYNTLAGQMERLDSLGVDPLALPGQYVYDVRYSPDTTRIAAVVLSSLARPVRRLFVMNNTRADSTRGRGVRVLAEGTIEGPIAWSPTGDRIAYARTVRGRYGSLVNDLYVVEVATGRTTRLTRDRRAVSPSFSPDGRRLAFVGVDAATANVFVLDLDTGAEAPLTRFTGDVQITAARWSPRGDRVALAVFDAEGHRQLMTAEVATGALQPLPAGLGLPMDVRDDRQPVWRPDGAALAYTSLRDDAPNVFALDLVEGPEVTADGGRWTEDRGRRAEGGGQRTESDAAPSSSLGGGAPAGGGGGDGAAEDRPHPARQTSPLEEAGVPGDTLATKPDARAAPEGGYAESLIDRAAPETEEAGAAQRPSPVVGPPTPPEETRVTFLFDGATVHDWLPPDALHPEGRFVLVATETKRRDRVFVVDARRRPTVAASATPAQDALVVPPAYAAWTAHRPPEEVPDRIAPDASLIEERYGYNSIKNLTHAITLPLPYADPENDDYGVFANSIWLEPLGKHQLFFLGGVSFTRFVDKSFLLLEYTNNTLTPTLTLDLYRFPSPAVFYGERLLVENLTGGDLSATWPLDVTDAPFTQVLAGARVRYAYAEPYRDFDFGDLDASGGMLLDPEDGFRADLQLGFAWKRQRPYRYNVLNPLDGTGLRARVTLGAPVLGADNRFVRPDVAAYTVLPALGFGQLYLYGRATALFGEQLAQDYIGLSRFDDVDVQLPFFGSATLDDAERVRGYRRYAVGDRVLFGTAEYRLPPVLDLNTNLLGVVELDRVSLGLFADAAVVWTGSAFDEGVRRTGVGIEAANLVRIGGFGIRHALGVAVPWGQLDEDLVWDDVDLYYRVQAAVPF